MSWNTNVSYCKHFIWTFCNWVVIFYLMLLVFKIQQCTFDIMKKNLYLLCLDNTKYCMIMVLIYCKQAELAEPHLRFTLRLSMRFSMRFPIGWSQVTGEFLEMHSKLKKIAIQNIIYFNGVMYEEKTEALYFIWYIISFV